MIAEITPDVLQTIQNPHLKAYAERYLKIAKNYQEQICQTGIEIAPVSPAATGEP